MSSFFNLGSAVAFGACLKTMPELRVVLRVLSLSYLFLPLKFFQVKSDSTYSFHFLKSCPEAVKGLGRIGKQFCTTALC